MVATTFLYLDIYDHKYIKPNTLRPALKSDLYFCNKTKLSLCHGKRNAITSEM